MAAQRTEHVIKELTVRSISERTSALLLMIVFTAATVDAEHAAGNYFGQTPPGTSPARFAPGIVSTEGYDITPTFSPALDEVFWGCRPTQAGSDNRIYHSKCTGGVWSDPALATFSSGAMEFEAQFSCDGLTLYYNRSGDIYSSERTDSGWSPGRQLAPPVNEGMCIATATDGGLYFTAARAKQYGIWKSGRTEEGYSEPELVVPFAAHPFVAPDESYLLCDRYGDNRTSRLYVCFPRKDGTWSEPTPLGDEINATGTELIAKVSPDGKYLFFQRKLDNNTDVYWVDASIVAELRAQLLE